MPNQNDAANYLRAAIGQGLGMGWGDEAEAWLRSKLQKDTTYERELKKLNEEYGEFSKRNPKASAAAELGGGLLPVAASMLIPGAQGAAPVTAARTAGTLARLAGNPFVRGAAVGATTGAISGAGSARPGERGQGAVVGGTVGTAVGAGAPVVIRSAGSGARWLRDRLAPTEQTVTTRAAEKVNRALGEANLTPADVEARVAADRARGIPSTVANANPALVDLAETVAQRSGPSGRRVEETLGRQTMGARERTYAQTRNALQPGDFYADEQRILQELRDSSAPAYRQAYAVGEVDDPMIMEMLQMPQFKSAWGTARQIAEADAAAARVNAMRSGQPFNPDEYKLRDVYSITRDMETGAPIGVEVTGTVPDVRTLDYMKRALDAQISAGYRSDNAATVASANAFKDLRNALRDRTKEIVPEYRQALDNYRGDMEVLNALRSGMNDFRKMDHEQIIQLTKDLTPTELEAFRTGVVRNIYGMIMDPSSNINAAQRVIGAPEMQAKLQPLFNSPAQFNLFKSALEREAQLFQQSNRILGGAATGRRTQARERFEEGPGVGQVVGDAIVGGFGSSLTNLAARVARSATMTDDVADKVAQLLMSTEPAEVAAAVKLLEEYGARSAQSARNLSRAEAGTIFGTVSTSQPAPPGPEANVEADLGAAVTAPATGPSIEEDIKAEKPRQPVSVPTIAPTPAAPPVAAPPKIEGPDIEADIAAELEAERRARERR